MASPRSHTKGVRSSPGGVVIGLALLSLTVLQSVQREDWRAVVHLLTSRSELGDGIILWAPLAVTPFRFALDEVPKRPPVTVLYPAGPPIHDVVFAAPQPGFARQTSRRVARLWLVSSHDETAPGEPRTFPGLTAYYRQVEEYRFPDIDVVFYERRAPRGPTLLGLTTRRRFHTAH
jgi:hypothetical protein